uniref:Protein kinase domain-containing protein n=1 Tax=Leersia perrieri TaxID=77586 RepID=A0A0D9WSD3_9ORYZ
MAALSAAALVGLLLALAAVAGADTDGGDVSALGNLYTSWNNPGQLTGWSADGGDPCGAAWMGVSCVGSAVTSIKLSGMGLNGTLGYQLSNLLALKTMNLARNNFSGNLPFSISNMVSLNYLNLSHNLLFQEIGEMFGNLKSLSEIDVSFNNLSGNLPISLGSLSSISSLYMQNNRLSGTVNVLSNLSLTTLLGGNSFLNVPLSPTPIITPPPQGQPDYPPGPTTAPNIPEIPIDQGSDKKQRLQTGLLIGIVVGSMTAACGVLFALVLCLHNVRKSKDGGSSESKDIAGSFAVNIASNREIWVNTQQDAPVASSVLPPVGKMTPDRVYVTNGSVAKKLKFPVTANPYTVASLQVATNSFCQDSLLGEGSLGRVYKADFPNGKVLAVKKIDSASLSLYEEDNFLEVVSSISRLRHPNIVPLTGYCVEHGQRLLVYEHIGNGTLHDILHFSDEMSKNLTWNNRVRIALGTARALEYLHEVCLPPVVHKNLKSSNILLDKEYSPHLSDCGLAALTPNPEREVSTEVFGSFGYSAPEFAMSGIYTVKSDVYSFGVVMLELLTARKPLDSSRERSEQSLVTWATPQLHDIDALSKMPEPEFRPPMSEVVQQLVRLVQRASMVRRQSGEDLGLSYRNPDREGGTADTI